MTKTTTDDGMFGAYPPGIEHHYWTVARNRLLLRQLERYGAHRKTVLDVGCGPGIVVGYLRARGVDCYGVDPNAPRVARDELVPWVQTTTSAFDLPAQFRSSVDALLLMDVLEHLAEPVQFLEQCHSAFTRARYLFVTLPARMEIWSGWDERYGHYRRYTLESFRAEVADSPWTLLESRYVFRALYGAARTLKWLGVERAVTVEAPRGLLLHRALATALIQEARWLPGRLPGSSLFAVLAR